MFGAKPLSEPLLVCCQFDHWEQIPVKFDLKYNDFPPKKLIGKYRLRNNCHFVSAAVCLAIELHASVSERNIEASVIVFYFS